MKVFESARLQLIGFDQESGKDKKIHINNLKEGVTTEEATAVKDAYASLSAYDIFAVAEVVTNVFA
ncbi:DUF1659 domain-containing protein [Aerococcus sanguinicola]|uniref:DUF1659 domain-containing protein n=1 Tax=unclassified Aerococcus TaxID=2618060 RepID=UPI0008A26FAD|nr:MULTISPECIES: hypothetical protein [unclassified Aerococcus]KAB0647879.1 hypothetical protein F6I01_00085 [Aerococcus sanguinicola]MDK6234220.1 hypothetical protein [Aerococcus sp. UMB10185]MDK6804434.1 hypothetical protein [Aerococcus sp. UMB7834]MDK6856451.1 hypothetical protein [Aerococcus sp. UMB7533]MDK8503207.1 hypothetical protein [Aerococcus sp. UMB1112A]